MRSFSFPGILMDIPRLCDRVRVREHGESVYIVVKVDQESGAVDLAPASGHGRGLDDVPFSDLLRPGEPLA